MPSEAPARPVGRRRGALAGMLVTVALVLAPGVGSVTAADISPRELVPLLTRTGFGPDQVQIDIVFAPPLFFEATGIPVPDGLDLETSLAFMLQENIHEGELPIDAPEAFLLMPDGTRVAPAEMRVTADDIHHRVSRLVFGLPADWPASIEDGNGHALLRLIVPKADGSYAIENTFEWQVPVVFDDAAAPAEQ